MNNQAQLAINAMYSFMPTDQDHVAINVIPSGWRDRYHIIIEDAVYGSRMLSDTMSTDEIKLKYGVSIPKDSLSITKSVKDHPNNYDLGEVVRKYTQFK